MSKSLYEEWNKELQVLLKKIEQHPSADLDAERTRVQVLNTLIAKHVETAEA